MFDVHVLKEYIDEVIYFWSCIILMVLKFIINSATCCIICLKYLVIKYLEMYREIKLKFPTCFAFLPRDFMFNSNW